MTKNKLCVIFTLFALTIFSSAELLNELYVEGFPLLPYNYVYSVGTHKILKSSFGAEFTLEYVAQQEYLSITDWFTKYDVDKLMTDVNNDLFGRTKNGSMIIKFEYNPPTDLRVVNKFEFENGAISLYDQRVMVVDHIIFLNNETNQETGEKIVNVSVLVTYKEEFTKNYTIKLNSSQELGYVASCEDYLVYLIDQTENDLIYHSIYYYRFDNDTNGTVQNRLQTGMIDPILWVSDQDQVTIMYNYSHVITYWVGVLKTTTVIDFQSEFFALIGHDQFIVSQDDQVVAYTQVAVDYDHTYNRQWQFKFYDNELYYFYYDNFAETIVFCSSTLYQSIKTTGDGQVTNVSLSAPPDAYLYQAEYQPPFITEKYTYEFTPTLIIIKDGAANNQFLQAISGNFYGFYVPSELSQTLIFAISYNIESHLCELLSIDITDNSRSYIEMGDCGLKKSDSSFHEIYAVDDTNPKSPRVLFESYGGQVTYYKDHTFTNISICSSGNFYTCNVNGDFIEADEDLAIIFSVSPLPLAGQVTLNVVNLTDGGIVNSTVLSKLGSLAKIDQNNYLVASLGLNQTSVVRIYNVVKGAFAWEANVDKMSGLNQLGGFVSVDVQESGDGYRGSFMFATTSGNIRWYTIEKGDGGYVNFTGDYLFLKKSGFKTAAFAYSYDYYHIVKILTGDMDSTIISSQAIEY